MWALGDIAGAALCRVLHYRQIILQQHFQRLAGFPQCSFVRHEWQWRQASWRHCESAYLLILHHQTTAQLAIMSPRSTGGPAQIRPGHGNRIKPCSIELLLPPYIIHGS